MPTVPLTALRTFEAVARTGSFRAAADALFVSQSAVSHQVRHLEDWLGRRLFERKGNRTLLLPHGEDLARALSESFTEIEAACRRAGSSAIEQPIVIAAIPSIAMCWLIPRLSSFRAAHPDIEVQVIYALHGREINFRDVHIAFVFAERLPHLLDVDSRFFLPGASGPVCSPVLLDRHGHAPSTPEDFLSLGLLHDGDASGWQEWLRQAGHTSEQKLAGPVFEDFNLLRAAALSGQGIALCALSVIRPDIDAGRLIPLSDRTVLNDHDYYLLTRLKSSSSTTESIRTFHEWALDARDTSALQA
ncbi:LysR family transcriptional regulator [Sedimentitalea todarodis]|uniref:LysR family transcriptional regulator n=1 Tax=Sedimentitalea todarodis TaxID=1631240 RepID=A0ABU3VH71_9RHOB|nr:LysR family transcriptional regulator [Sedimentitalea todarodis]MDU9005536.1 LysR family transcriptional regulator [Sedimentitalea todarodis]